MTKREKVIETIKHCFPFGSRGCKSCPYIHDIDINKGCMMSLTDDILTLLNEPASVEPESVEPKMHLPDEKKIWGSWYNCGACGCTINPEDNFCSKCGRPIKWKEGRND